MAADQPDILFMHCHDLGRRLPIYGESAAATPGLNRIATEGLCFDRFHSTSTLCSPARGSILTGRYPHQVGLCGLTNRGWDLLPGEKGIPAFLAEAGYRTELFGLQHEAKDAGRLGYAHVERLPHSHPGSASDVAEQVRARLRTFTPRAGRDPFYLNVGFFEPHRHDFWERYRPIAADRVRVPRHLPDTPGVRADLARYDGLAKAMDAAVAAILSALDETGLARDTLVLFTTDHGIAFPGAKVNVYDPGIGVAAPDNVAGQSFRPALLGAPCAGHDAVFAEATYHSVFDPVRCVRTNNAKLIRNYDSRPAVHTGDDVNPNNGILAPEDYGGRWTRIRPPIELYDLNADPGETENQADAPAFATLNAALLEQLDDWQRATDDPMRQRFAGFRGDTPSRMPSIDPALESVMALQRRAERQTVICPETGAPA